MSANIDGHLLIGNFKIEVNYSPCGVACIEVRNDSDKNHFLL